MGIKLRILTAHKAGKIIRIYALCLLMLGSLFVGLVPPVNVAQNRCEAITSQLRPPAAIESNIRRDFTRLQLEQPNKLEPEPHSSTTTNADSAAKFSSAGTIIYRIESPVKLEKGAIHKKDEVDVLLLQIAMMTSEDNFEFLADLYSLQDLITPDNISRLFLAEMKKPKIAYDEPQLPLAIQDLILTIWLQRNGEMRPRPARSNLIEYVIAARRFTVGSKFVWSIVENVLNGGDRGLLVQHSFEYRKLFNREHIEKVLNQAREGNDLQSRQRARIVMEQLVYAGVPVTLSAEVLLELLQSTEDLHINTYTGGGVNTLTTSWPIALLTWAINYNPQLASDPEILKFIQRHREKVKRFIQEGNNSKLYADSIDGIRMYDKELDAAIQKATSGIAVSESKGFDRGGSTETTDTIVRHQKAFEALQVSA